MYAALAVVNIAAVVVPARDTLAARRWLTQHPLAGGATDDHGRDLWNRAGDRRPIVIPALVQGMVPHSADP